MDFIEQVYKSVDYDCFNLILDFVKINRETEYNKRLFHHCFQELLGSVCKPVMHPSDNYIISKFNLNKIYEPLQLGIKCSKCDAGKTVLEYHYDKDYYDGLDFLLNKCSVFAFIQDDDDVDQFIMFVYELKDKNTKFRKSYEENGYDNEEDFRIHELDASCEFNYNDSFLTGEPLQVYLSSRGELETYSYLDFSKDEDGILEDLRNIKICQLLF